jgi:hypothetical protein
MSYYTATDLRQMAGGITASAARAELAHSSISATRTYDLFLSHSLRDEVLIVGLKRELERLHLTVYVDWIEDPALDRQNVSPQTARKLKHRMNSCKALIYATSQNSTKSKWMPWELGYFDAQHGEESVAICPIADGEGSVQGRSTWVSTNASSRSKMQVVSSLTCSSRP